MLFRESELRARAQTRTVVTAKKSDDILEQGRTTSATSFDIFLSHSILDSELVLGARLKLEEYGFTVYVDWINDPKLDRSQVTPETAAHLRRRMRQCKMLAYLHTSHSAISRWCPWELGFFDALRGGNVFIMPVVSDSQHSFAGQEYLGLYPYLEPASASQNIKIEKADGFHFLTEARTKVFTRKIA